MAGGKCDYLEKALLDGVLGGPDFTLPPIVHIALSTGPYVDSGLTAEVTSAGTGYGRVAVTNNSTNWPAASLGSGLKANGSPFTFATATADWGTIVSFYIMDAASGGNSLYGADLTTPKSVQSGDSATFGTGAIAVTEA